MTKSLVLCAAVMVAGHACASVIDDLRAGQPLRLAHRDASVPFSYIHPETGKAVGYSMDICMKMAEALARKVGKKAVPVEFVQVTSANRIEVIEKRTAHLECGSTTNNAERRQRVAFTIPHYITGARLLVKAGSPVDRLEDLMGRKLVSTRGSTPLQAVTQLSRERLMRINIVESPDHAKGVEMVERGEVDAFAMDDVLLFGLAAGRPDPKSLKVVGKFITTEALAIMLPKGDVELKKVVDEEMRRLIYSREIHQIYEKWFMRPIPPGNTALDLPVNHLLRDFWKYPTDHVPT